jgi:drug/metabolite transporter (DMT)-like permease
MFLKQPMTGRFMLGSAIAMAGIALLFVQEMRQSAAGPADVLFGIGLTVCGVLSASAANVLQASERMRSRPISVTLAWGMLYGVIANALVASLLFGAPVVETRAVYWVGLLYLGLFASALAFTLYFAIVREIGPAKAAYSSVLVPIIAMALSTLFEGYRWSTLAAAGGVLTLAGLVVALRARTAAAG